jgi:hypothetical protein
VPTNTIVTVNFSERVNPLTVVESSFRLFNLDLNFAQVAGTIAVAGNALSATFTPSAPLEPNTHYRMYVSNQTLLTDLAGNIFGYQFDFTTGGGTDTTAPMVTMVSPPNGASEVPVNASVQVLVNEPVDPLSVGSGSLTLTGGGALAGTVTSSGQVVKFQPSANLATSTLYTVNASGFRDVAGNTVVPFSSTFTTSSSAAPDTTAPTVTETSPVSGATGVPTNTVVTVSFSEQVNPLSVNDSSLKLFDISTFSQVAGTIAVAANGLSATFTPSAPLATNTSFSMAVGYQTLPTDLAGNQFSSSFTFTTGP